MAAPRLLASSIESSRGVVTVPTNSTDARLAVYVMLKMRMRNEKPALSHW